MLSHNFLINGKAPWGKSTTVSEKFLERGREYLIQGRIEDAIKTFSYLIANPTKHEHLQWAYLLRCYAYRLNAYFHEGVERKTLISVSNFDYVSACKTDSDLAYKECQGYGLIGTWLECLIALFRFRSEKLDLPKLHAQVWHIFYSDNLFHSEKINESIEEATRGLERLPSNHFLLFTRSAAWLSRAVDEANTAFFDRAADDLTLAIQFCPAIPESGPNLSRYYLHRGQIRYMQKKVEDMLDDFKSGMEYDFADNDAFDTNFRLATLKQVLLAYVIPPISFEKLKVAKIKNLKRLTAEIVKEKTKSDLYLSRGKIYAELGEWTYALFDYSLALWLIKVRLDPQASCSQKMVEAKLEQLKKMVPSVSSRQEEKSKSEAVRDQSAEAAAKKKAKRDRQKQKLETQSYLRGLVYQVVDRAKTLIAENEAKLKLEQQLRGLLSRLAKNIVSEAKERERKQEEDKQRVLKQEQKKKQKVLHHIQGTLAQMVQTAALIAEEKKRKQEEERQLKLKEEQVKRQEELNQVQDTLGEILDTVVLEAEAEQEKKEEERLREQEKLLFKPVGRVFIPTQVAEVGRRLKALPGRCAKRTHLYGGKGRDEMLLNTRESFDYDLRTALPLKEAAPVLKEVFGLNEEPKEEYGLIQLSFPTYSAQGDKRQAVLALSHSEILANEKLSYVEALKSDALTFDFIQNAFIAIFPERGSVCPVFYPLDWWDFYFSPHPANMAAQFGRNASKEALSVATVKLTGNAIFLVGEGRDVRVYIFIGGKVETFSPGFKRALNFNLQLEEKDRELLASDENGRVQITPENQNRVNAILTELNEKCLHRRGQALDRLKGKVVERLLLVKQLETIMEPILSFSYDPIRMLRAIYLTNALGYSELSASVGEGIRLNLNSYLSFIMSNPAKHNSWMNKLFCRDGKLHLIENFNGLSKAGLLQLSFPGLAEAIFKDDKLRQWLNTELLSLSCSERPSLNYVYAVFIACLALKLQKSTLEIMQSNVLFSVNFKEFNPSGFLEAAFNSWNRFLKAQAVPAQPSSVDINFNVNLNLQINQVQYVNINGNKQVFFATQQQASKQQQAQVPPVYSARL